MAPMRLAKGSTKVVIREEYVGSASEDICYPGISSCISITGVAPAGLVGAHITVSTELDLVDQIMQAMRTGGGSSCVSFYVIGAFVKFKSNTKTAAIDTRKKISQKIKSGINDKAVVSFYDTSGHGDVHVMAEKNGMAANFFWIAQAGHIVAGDAYPTFAGRSAINASQFMVR
jgi:hypothetical protein